MCRQVHLAFPLSIDQGVSFFKLDFSQAAVVMACLEHNKVNNLAKIHTFFIDD
tara:strand:- start:74135 stop:74293 length:159 start_codon:yes stop_codon:yes gene_type:complete